MGDGGTHPPLFSVGGQHRNCPPPTFQLNKLRGISPDSPLLSLKSRYTDNKLAIWSSDHPLENQLRRYPALSVFNLVLILFLGSSHQAHCKWWNLCCTFTPRLLDAYRLWQKRRIPPLCVTYCHLSDEKFLCQNVGLGSSTQHGRRSVGDERDASPHFSAWGVSIGNILTLFLVHTTNLKAYNYSETDHSLLL